MNNSHALRIVQTPLLDAIRLKASASGANAPSTLEGDTMKRVFVCSPYRDEDELQVAQNVIYAAKFCRYVIKHGAVPFAAHLLYPQFLDDEECDDRDCGLRCALTFLATCNEMWVFVPRERKRLTEGMKLEMLEAVKLKKPLKFFYYSEQGEIT